MKTLEELGWVKQDFWWGEHYSKDNSVIYIDTPTKTYELNNIDAVNKELHNAISLKIKELGW